MLPMQQNISRKSNFRKSHENSDNDKNDGVAKEPVKYASDVINDFEFVENGNDMIWIIHFHVKVIF